MRHSAPPRSDTTSVVSNPALCVAAGQSKGIPKTDVPVVLLGRLAVDRSMQGQGLGSDLLIDALYRANSIAEHLGIRVVEVHALDDDARAFYLKFGFVELKDDPHHLFLPIQWGKKL